MKEGESGMTHILVYNCVAKTIERLANERNTTEAEVLYQILEVNEEFCKAYETIKNESKNETK